MVRLGLDVGALRQLQGILNVERGIECRVSHPSSPRRSESPYDNLLTSIDR